MKNGTQIESVKEEVLFDERPAVGSVIQETETSCLCGWYTPQGSQNQSRSVTVLVYDMVDEYAVLFRNYCPSRIQLILATLYLHSWESLLTFLSLLVYRQCTPSRFSRGHKYL